MNRRIRMKLKYKREFTAKARKAIHKRDGERCLFCEMGYYLPDQPALNGGMQIMHIVARSQNGMGVEQNGVLGCVWHHIMLDNGNKGRRAEMLQMLEDYIKELYPGWTRESVTIHKHPDYKKISSGSRPDEDGTTADVAEAAGFIPVEGVSGEIPL